MKLTQKIKRRCKELALQTLPRHTAKTPVVYYACIQKTASQWMKLFFQDLQFYRATGYRMTCPEEDYVTLSKLTPKVLNAEPNTIIGPLYARWPELQAMQPTKPACKTFYVWRDPRDYLISSYHSLRYTHGEMGSIAEFRANEAGLSDEEGLRRYIRQSKPGNAYYDCLNEWSQAQSESLKIFRYEDIFGVNQNDAVQKLLAFMEVELKPALLERLLAKYDFNKLRNAKKGKKQHLRSGKAGQFRELNLTAEFEPHVLTLCDKMGYRI